MLERGEGNVLWRVADLSPFAENIAIRGAKYFCCSSSFYSESFL